MIRIFTLAFVILGCTLLNAQKKSDLIAEIDQLKSELSATKQELAESKRNERVSKTEAENMKLQMEQLEESNTSLMQNLNNLTQLSKKTSENVDSSLASLKKKEEQLKGITDAIAKNDSTSVSMLTQIKQTMGEDAQVSVHEGALVITQKQEALFSSGNTNEITPAGKEFLKKIADLLNANPDTELAVESLGASVDLLSASTWSAALTSALQKEFEITPDRVLISFVEAGFVDEVRFKLQPKYSQFYTNTKEYMKN